MPQPSLFKVGVPDWNLEQQATQTFHVYGPASESWQIESSCCGINFLFLREAVSFRTQWQKEKAIRAEGSGDFYVFPTSLFCALKQDQMFQR